MNVSSRIIVLDPETANQIAAGEVIERPASVVKELVENSLDAGASRVNIEIEYGGMKLVRVRDDGTGIHGQDVRLAFARHATSKIRRAEDLFGIHTLGFRGEALPSIAAVARVEMDTRPPGALAGKKVRIAGGEFLDETDTGCPPGTVVTVTDLFFNTPARRQYMKQASAESRAVAAVVEKLSIAHPDVAFNLTVDGRRTLFTPGNGDLRAVIASIYGLEISRELLLLERMGIQGLISPPGLHRATRSHQVFIVNGRCVLNRAMTRAVEGSYKNVIPPGRYPLFFLHIHTVPGEIDVNVHPAKLEVRFQKERELTSAVSAAVRDRFVSPRVVAAPLITGNRRKEEGPFKAAQQKLFLREKESPGSWGEYILKEKTDAVFAAVSEEKTITAAVPRLVVLAQLFNTYILAEGEDGLYIIDQHAAHELCRFETLQKQAGTGPWPVQMLEPPQTLELTPAQTIRFNETREELTKHGFMVENFGSSSYLLRSVPMGIPLGREKEVLKDFLDDSFTPAPDGLLKLIACHGAVKAGEPLSIAEMQRLLDELRETNRPFTCPHGRTAVVRFDHHQLARFFQRSAN